MLQWLCSLHGQVRKNLNSFKELFFQFFALFPSRVGKIFFTKDFYRPLFIFENSKMKSVTEKGFPSSLHYAVTRGKASTTKPTFGFPQKGFPAAPTPSTSFIDLCRELKITRFRAYTPILRWRYPHRWHLLRQTPSLHDKSNQ